MAVTCAGRAWREGVERPFLLDNLWDLLHVVDYLVTRPEVDPQRIGITGGPLLAGSMCRVRCMNAFFVAQARTCTATT